MAERCVGVSRKALSRASDWVDKRKEKVDGTCEAQMYVVMGRVFVFVYGLLMSGLGALTVFSGPGSDHVVSAANNVVSALPEDLQKDVRESKPPLPYLRDCLGFDAPNVSGMPPSSGTTSTSSEPTDTQGEN